MTRPGSIVAAVIVVAALAAPVAADAQATRRGGSDRGSSSGGGAGGGEASGGSGGAVAVPRHPSPQPSPAPAVREPASRPASVSGGASRPAVRQPAAGSDARVTPGARSATPSSAGMRIREAQAIRGTAQPRTSGVAPSQPSPSDRWYRSSPWYGYGYGYSYRPGAYGYSVFDPWYGGGLWGWNRYRWHDPFLFNPYGYVGFTPYYWPASDLERDDDRDQGAATGSVRLRVNPDHARVYVNGALAGVASDFGGLSTHLVLPAGMHELELRADGYVSRSVQVNVRNNRTQTERISLTRQ